MTRSLHIPSLFLFLFCILGFIAMLGLGVFLLLSGILSLIRPAFLPDSTASPESDFLLASAGFLCAALLLPAMVYSLGRLVGKPIPELSIRPIRLWQAGGILALWVVIVLLGDWLGASLEPAWAVTPLFYLPAIALPPLLLLWIALGGLPLGSHQRAWGTFSVGMLAGPGLAMMAEFVIYLGLAALGIILLFLHPEWTGTFSSIQSQISAARDLDAIMTILAPYLANPLVILLAFVILSVLVPLIEELVKPVAVWMMAGRLSSPVQGFALGALSGAGFALVEGLVAAASSSQGWGALLAARACGSLMHILTSGLMGWGIISAWHKRHPMHLAGAFALAISIHGLWNGATVLIVYSALRPYLAGNGGESLDSILSMPGVTALVALFTCCLVALVLVNRKLQPHQPSPVQ